ncbi:hypothetical protein BDQ17DRAFT_1440496 [Cyathus striatus]|nr:hypothetical protein BDQ17DRAFT_1440496 [Cyathus striatus]
MFAPGIKMFALGLKMFALGPKMCAPNNARNVCARIKSVQKTFSISHIDEYFEKFNKPDIIFSKRGAIGAASIVKLLNLDVQRASSLDLDRIDARLVCNTCPNLKHPGYSRKGRLAYTWRAAVSHFVECAHDPDWLVLELEEMNNVKAMEINSLKNIEAWSCNRCSCHYDQRVTRYIVCRHLKKVHKISQPDITRDLIVNRNSGQSYYKLGAIFLAAIKPTPPRRRRNTFKCLRCPDDITPFFNKQGVMSHIKAKHNIFRPEMGMDWKNTAF